MFTRTLPLLVLLSACAADPQPMEPPVREGPLDIRSLSYPAHWLVEQVGGEQVQLRNILPPGKDTPHWQPSAELIAGLSESDLIVANGAGFEAWVATATMPADKLVFTAKGVDLIHLESATHSHGTGGEHSHGEIDPHTWGSPAVFAQQAHILAAALGKADPINAAIYTQSAGVLEADLTEIGRVYTDAFSRAGDSKLACNHPAYNYLARQLDVDIHAFDYAPTAVPSEQDLAAFAAWAGDTAEPILLWEAIPSSEVKAAFPAGVRHVWLDPLEQPASGGTYDYLAQVRNNVATIGDLFPLDEVEHTKRPGQFVPKPGAPADAKPSRGKGAKGR